MENLHPISHKFVWIKESKHHTLLDDLQNIQSPMHTLVVVEDIEVAEQVTQFLDGYGISVHNYDFDHKDQAIGQSFRSGEIPILITTVEEDFYEEFTGTTTNVLVVDVPLFTTSQYSSYKELLAKPEGHLTFYVDNDNWLSVAYVIKQLLEQGISLTTDSYPPSPKSPSSPYSHPSMADASVCLRRLDSFALAQHNVDELKYEPARLAQQIQQLSCKLNVPHSHTDMAPELVHSNSNHPCTKPEANMSRSEFVPLDLDSSATDPISESITQLHSPKVTEDYIHCPLSPFLGLEEETLGDLENLQQTCHAPHAELLDTLTYNKGPPSSDTVVRYDTSSLSQEEVVLLDHSPVSNGEMYADTGWYMSYQNHDPLGKEPNLPEPSCQASIITLCDNIFPDVLLRASQQLLNRAGLNGHRSAPNDHTGQPPPLCGTPPAYQPCPPIEYVCLGMPCPQVDSPPVFSLQSSNCNGDNVPTQSQDEYPVTQTDQVLAESISDYDYDDNHSHSNQDDENIHCHDSDYQHGYSLDPFNLKDHTDLDSSWNSDQDSWFSLKNSPGHPPVSLESPTTEADPHEAMAEEQPLAFQQTESPAVMANVLLPCPIKMNLLPVMISLGCRNTLHSQSLSDISPAQAGASYTNPSSLPYLSVDCIPACRGTLVPDGILQRQVLPRPKS